MLTSAQYTRIISLDNQGHSVRNIRKLYGYSRNTIKKVLNSKIQPSFKTPFRPSKLDDYKDFVKDNFNNAIKGMQIYEGIIKDGYNGSYSTVRRYLADLAKDKEQISNESPRTKQKRNEYNAGWALTLLQGKMSLDEIEARFEEHIDRDSIKILYN